MRTKIAFLLLFAAAAAAQSLSVSVSPGSTTAGADAEITVSFSAGTAPIAALQFTQSFPGVTVIGSSTAAAGAAAGKTLYCAGAGLPPVCIVYGINVTAIASGDVATFAVSLPNQNQIGPGNFTVTNIIASDPAGSAVSISVLPAAVATFFRSTIQ